MWALLRPDDSEELDHAGGLDSRSRHRQIGISGARYRRGGTGHHPPEVQAALGADVLSEVAGVSG